MTGSGVQGQHLVQVGRLGRPVGVQNPFDDHGDVGQGDPAVQIGGRGDLVGRVQGGRGPAAHPGGPESQLEAGEAIEIRFGESQPTGFEQVQRGDAVVDPLGKAQSEGDRTAHVRVGQLGDDRSVGVLHAEWMID